MPLTPPPPGVTRTIPLLLLLALVLLAAGCTAPCPSCFPEGTTVPTTGMSAGPEGNCTPGGLDGTTELRFLGEDSCYFRDHAPMDFLHDLRGQPSRPVMVLGVPEGWITRHDAELLMGEIDNGEPAAPVVSPLSSYWPFNQTSTVGNEALFLLEGYRLGRYPPALCSVYYFKPNRTEVQEWWEHYGREGLIDERDAIRMVQDVYPELWEYPSDGLPPRSIRTEHAVGGWYVAFLQEGSGLPILSARCYFAGDNRTVLATGTVNRSIMVMPSAFSPQRCGE